MESVVAELGAVGRCPRCRRGVHVPAEVARSECWQVKSPCCGRWVALHSVRGTVSSRRCDAHCEDATGATCKCECGGIRHGITWRIK